MSSLVLFAAFSSQFILEAYTISETQNFGILETPIPEIENVPENFLIITVTETATVTVWEGFAPASIIEISEAAVTGLVDPETEQALPTTNQSLDPAPTDVLVESDTPSAITTTLYPSVQSTVAEIIASAAPTSTDKSPLEDITRNLKMPQNIKKRAVMNSDQPKDGSPKSAIILSGGRTKDSKEITAADIKAALATVGKEINTVSVKSPKGATIAQPGLTAPKSVGQKQSQPDAKSSSSQDVLRLAALAKESKSMDNHKPSNPGPPPHGHAPANAPNTKAPDLIYAAAQKAAEKPKGHVVYRPIPKMQLFDRPHHKNQEKGKIMTRDR